MSNKQKNDFFLEYMKKQQEKQLENEMNSQITNKTVETMKYRFMNIINIALDIFNKILYSLLSTKRMIRIFAFILAISFYVSIRDGKSSSIVSERVPDIEVQEMNLDDQYLVEGIPEYVFVYIDGTSVQIQLAKIKGFNVFCDLQHFTEGVYENVPLKATDIYGGAKATIIPESISVQIYKKEKKEFPLTYRFINEDLLPDNVVVQKPNLGINSIMIFGKNSDLEKVAKVDCVIDLEDVTKPTNAIGIFKAFDAYDNEITGISFEQESMSVSLQTARAKKEIPIRPIFIGLSDSWAVSMITYSDPIYYYGDPSILSNYNEIKVEINLPKMDDRYMIYDIPLTYPNDVTCSESKITVTLAFENRETRTYANVPIVIKGLEDQNYKLSEATCMVKLTGAPTRLNQISLEDINVYATIANTDTLHQTLDLNVKCSDPLINVELVDQNQVDIDIQD